MTFSLVIRLYLLTADGGLPASAQSSARSIVAASSRGMIYDRNLCALVRRNNRWLVCVLPGAASAQTLKQALSEAEYNDYYEKLQRGSLVIFETDSPELYTSCPDIAVLNVSDRYTSPQTAAHIIGHLNSDSSRGVYGVEKCFDEYLSQYSGSLTLYYNTDALGRVLTGADARVHDSGYNSAAGIALTLDSDLQQITEQALASCGYKTGAAVVLDANTAQLLACASVPVFDCNNVAASLTDADSPFLNRALTSYCVGSVFKLVVAAAALESGIDESFSYTCTGSCVKGGTRFACHKASGHGELDMKTAFTVSCNTYFIELAQHVGAQQLLFYAESFGFTGEIELLPGFSTDAAVLPELASIDSPAALSNLAFGQGGLLATPVHLAACYLAAINGGTYYAPTLYAGKVDAYGELTDAPEPSLPKKVISVKTSKLLKDYLFLTVQNGSGKPAKSDNYLCGGKTATAQTGRFDGRREILNAWFVGYYPYNNPKYIIAVIKEDGTTGSADAAPVFSKICNALAGTD